MSRLRAPSHYEDVRENVLGSKLQIQRHERRRLRPFSSTAVVLAKKDALVAFRDVPPKHWYDAVVNFFNLAELDFLLEPFGIIKGLVRVAEKYSRDLHLSRDTTHEVSLCMNLSATGTGSGR